MKGHTHEAEGNSYGSPSQTGSDFAMGCKAWGGGVLPCQEECGGGQGNTYSWGTCYTRDGVNTRDVSPLAAL